MLQLYISTVSPYSSKAAAMVGYSGLPCVIIRQNAVNRYSVMKRLTGKTMVPMLRDGGRAFNDSTEIAKFLMHRGQRPMLPRAKRMESLCWILEEFADEWMMRWMAYSRWTHLQNSREVQSVIGNELTAGIPGLGRVVGRHAGELIRRKIEASGITPENDVALSNSQYRCLHALENLLRRRLFYLFEGYPTVADFGFYGPLGQFASDYTGRKVLRGFPAIRGYIDRLGAMIPPMAMVESTSGPSRGIEEFQPLFAEFLGTYWPVLVSNFRALSQARPPKVVRATLVDGATFTFRPSRYMVGRFKELLTLFDEAYRNQDYLFGEEGTRLESALLAQVARLTHHKEGRQLLRGYQHLGMN